MNKTLMIGIVLACGFAIGRAQQIDVTRLDKIGSVTSFAKTEQGITLSCADNSQVELTVLASDLIRVRAAFAKPIPMTSHSWAIAKDRWTTTQWNVSETAQAITISTPEVEAIVRKSPLLIEFRDARTHQTINADEQPMAYDARGALAPIQFDPAAGKFIAVAKRLGFDEHFYGLGEKATHLDKRRGFFVNWNSDT